MDPDELRQRTKRFGLSVIKFIETLPSTQSARIIGNQLMRASLSVGANYHSACRGRSKADFISKIGIAIEEADGSLYWLDMLSEAQIGSVEKIQPLKKAAGELVSIFIASAKTARNNLNRQRQSK